MFYKGKKVLVTGTTGLIGTSLVLKLLDHGAHVRGLLHQKPSQIEESKIEYLKCDLTQREDCVRAVEGMDYVFHCAANSSGAVMMKNNPVAHITDNLQINSLLLEAAWRAKVERFQFLSTTTVYPLRDHPLREEEAFDEDPYEIYFGVGWMKRYIEKLCEFYHRRYQMKISILRPTNVYGPYDKFDFETSHVLPALIRRAIEKQNPFEVWGDGSAIRDFIYVDDMVEAMLRGLEKASDCSPINFGSGKPVTIKESVELILKISGQTSLKVQFDPSKPTTIPQRQVDLSRCRQVLGYEAQTPFEEGLKRTIDWYLKQSRKS